MMRHGTRFVYLRLCGVRRGVTTCSRHSAPGGTFEWDPFTTTNGAQSFCQRCRVIHSWDAEREDWWFGPGKFMIHMDPTNDTPPTDR
jgi:hypothetical protein